MALVVLLTLLYILSPVDVLPDLALGVGQIDDVLALLLGGGSTGALALARWLAGSRRGRRGCAVLLLALLAAVLGAALLLSAR